MKQHSTFRWMLSTLVSALLLLTLSAVWASTGIGNIQGFVKDVQGNPIVGAKVTLLGLGSPVMVTTDKSGEYVFTGIQQGAFTVKAGGPQLQTSTGTVNVLLDQTSELDFTLEPTEVTTGTSVVHIAPIPRQKTSTTNTISARIEQLDKSQPNNLYQQTGLLNYQPGVTVDSGQYPHLRGSDENATDYMIDGISIRDPISNEFATNLVTEGFKSTDLVTGGDDASYGGAVGGYVNSSTFNGRDLKGGNIEYTTSPGAWHYNGGEFEYGNITPNNKFDYAFANVDFQTKYPGNTQLEKLNSSHDESAKFNYYADANDTYTGYFSHGAEDYFYYPQGSSDYKLEPNTPTVVQTANGPVTVATAAYDPNAQPRALQTYDFVYGVAKHNFSPTAYLTYRIYKLHQNILNYLENYADEYVVERTQIVGNQLEYYNRLSDTNTARLGLQYLDKSGSYEYLVARIAAPITASNSFESRYYPAAPNETIEYAQDHLHAKNDVVSLDLGVRADQATFAVKQDPYVNTAINDPSVNPNGETTPGPFTKQYVDPRAGLAYSPDPTLSIHTSYAVNSQLPDLRRVEYLTGAVSGRLLTTTDEQEEADGLVETDRILNKLGPQHSNDFDLGFVKSATPGGFLGGKYQLSVTGFKKYTYDMLEENATSWDVANSLTGELPVSFDNGGHMHASGFEVAFQKAIVHQADTNGFLSYTNEVVRANNTYYDTTYEPYFVSSEFGNPFFYDSADPGSVAAAASNGVTINANNDFRVLNNVEFPTSYDQRHSVSVLINKRVSKLFESTIIMDAGSGYPIFSSATSESSPVGGSTPDGQHALVSGQLGGVPSLGEVPILTPSMSGIVPVNPVVGDTGWHYKFALNTSFYVTERFSLFLNVDNVFDRNTALVLGTGTVSGSPYYHKPTAQYPEGQEYFGPTAIITPIFLSFGFREKF